MKKWKKLQHNGILFPPAFESQGISIKIKGEKISLDLLQEEMVYQWAKKKDTPYGQDKVFQKNFTIDFAKTMNSKFKKISYSDIDFSQAYKLVDKEKDLKEMMTKEEKKSQAAKRKELREKMKEEYGKAIMDDKEVEVANYMAEPPGIFIGRGEHPLRGKWKKRVTHKDVTLNLGEKAEEPPGDWGEIIHNQDYMWLASWLDDLTKKRKYVWLADTAGIKQDRDKEKYEKAVKLSEKIEKIKDQMVKDMKSKPKKDKKPKKSKNKGPEKSEIATACYLIFRTAMRVGDEKDPDEADTVGATTLRIEHVKITDKAIEFDFLGKDGVRWQETVPAVGHDEQFQKNLQKLIANKKPDEDIFKGITSRHVNGYFSGIVEGLTAKVFRTYLASNVVNEYLKNHDTIKRKSANEKLYHAKLANLESAKMCNHKRTIPKTFDSALQKKKETLKKVKNSTPKTAKQKEKKKERVEKIKLQIDLTEKTRDYNLGTSLRNYIDPRLFKAWTDEVGAEWEKLYTAALQKKFLWVKNEKSDWKTVSKQY